MGGNLKNLSKKAKSYVVKHQTKVEDELINKTFEKMR